MPLPPTRAAHSSTRSRNKNESTFDAEMVGDGGVRMGIRQRGRAVG